MANTENCMVVCIPVMTKHNKDAGSIPRWHSPHSTLRHKTDVHALKAEIASYSISIKEVEVEPTSWQVHTCCQLIQRNAQHEHVSFLEICCLSIQHLQRDVPMQSTYSAQRRSTQCVRTAKWLTTQESSMLDSRHYASTHLPSPSSILHCLLQLLEVAKPRSPSL